MRALPSAVSSGIQRDFDEPGRCPISATTPIWEFPPAVPRRPRKLARSLRLNEFAPDVRTARADAFPVLS
jgi:hypothetical protein